MEDFGRALAIGAERLAGWADVLDQINVFPVADGDTGRNMLLTLTPLITRRKNRDELPEMVLFAARGNSGNIAAGFLSGLLAAKSMEDLPEAVSNGRDLAWKAVADPKPGTMLSLFDAFCDALDHTEINDTDYIVERLKQAVLDTPGQLKSLSEAGVVDSGALGMFLFLEGFLRTLTNTRVFTPVREIFGDYLFIEKKGPYEENEHEGCVSALLEVDEDIEERLKTLGNSVVVSRHKNRVKVHLHTHDTGDISIKMQSMGRLLDFSMDDIRDQQRRFARELPKPAVHIMTDAAGSVTREDAEDLGFTLLDSYVNRGTESIPETRVDSANLYDAMSRGATASTSQASTFERHQHYDKVTSLYGRTIYLCVGSAFTRNFSTAMEWKKEHDPDNNLLVIDTGAASGKLGVITLATAKFSLNSHEFKDVLSFARYAVEHSREYIFLDRLTFLARGGRLSRTKAFFGDMLNKKPVVSPFPDGVKRLAILRTRQEQEDWAIKQLKTDLLPTLKRPVMLMLEYTDNRERVRKIADRITELLPDTEIKIQPFSLTTGVHIGPGSWGLAFLRLPEGWLE